MMRHLISCGFVIWMVLGVLTSPARAHSMDMTGVRVRIDNARVAVSVVAHLHTLGTSDHSAEIARRLKLRLDDKAFRPKDIQLSLDKANGIVIWQGTSDASASKVGIEAPLFPERSDESTVVTVIKDRQVLGEAVVDARHPAATIGDAPEYSGTASVIRRFIREGIAHIFMGLDHVLFLLSLLLLGGTSRQLLKIATAFTVAHSITLSLAATGTLALSARFVEPVIALSIVAVAAINIMSPAHDTQAKTGGEIKPRRDLRPWLALGFGLIHGFGFAGALSEVGLPGDSLGWALGAFNLGVELGQIALILLFAPALAWLVKSRPRMRRPIEFYGSATVALVGALWFTQRIFTT